MLLRRVPNFFCGNLHNLGRYRPKLRVYSLRFIAGFFHHRRLSVNLACRRVSSEIFKTFPATAPLESLGVENRLVLRG
jgi:hypothetical protein